MYERNYTFLDIVTILSFVLQLQNQDKLLDIKDIQKEMQKVADKIDAHLQTQDDKIDLIMKYLQIENPSE